MEEKKMISAEQYPSKDMSDESYRNLHTHLLAVRGQQLI